MYFPVYSIYNYLLRVDIFKEGGQGGVNPDQNIQNHVKFKKLLQKTDEFCLALMIF